jgi:hypothetical protein
MTNVFLIFKVVELTPLLAAVAPELIPAYFGLKLLKFRGEFLPLVPVPLIDLAFRKTSLFRELYNFLFAPFRVNFELNYEFLDLILRLSNPVLLALPFA